MLKGHWAIVVNAGTVPGGLMRMNTEDPPPTFPEAPIRFSPELGAKHVLSSVSGSYP